MASISMLTTIDNPHDPFDDWRGWYNWDLRNGYDTPGYLARIAITSDYMSEDDIQSALMDAMTEIVEINATGMYKLVTRDEADIKVQK